MSNAARLALFLVAAASLAACRQATDVPLGSTYEVALDLPPAPMDEVDLLFVVDTSGSMAPHQAVLAAWARDELLPELAGAPGGLPDLHIGAITTDLGAGGYHISGCDTPGDDALLRSSPATTAHFLADAPGDGGERVRNYAGSLADAVTDLVVAGNVGCGFEQPLEALRRALDGSHPANDGFLRDDALLLVVLLTDEDDCSASDPHMFDPDGDPATFGPLASYRCFELGVVCDDDDPRAPGARTGCRPREDSAYIHPVGGYVDFLRGLKSDPGMVMVVGMFAPPGAIEVTTDSDGKPTLGPACSTPPSPDPRCDSAYVGPPDAGPDEPPGDGAPTSAPLCFLTPSPAVRLAALADAFPGRNAVVSMCDLEPATALHRSAAHVADVIAARPCLAGDLYDESAAPGTQPVCRAYDELYAGRSAPLTQELPACGAGGLPCHAIGDSAACAGDSGLAVDVQRAAAPAPGTHVRVECIAADD